MKIMFAFINQMERISKVPHIYIHPQKRIGKKDESTRRIYGKVK
jgi:hypothetical protein